MPRICTICTHDRRWEIDRALVGGTALSEVAALFRVSDDALSRHKSNHLPAKLSKAHEAEEVSKADDLLRQVKALQAKTLSLLLKAEAAGELRIALAAIREARGNLELLAKLAGELDERPVVNILIAPQAQQVIVQALYPYPEARQAVADALASLEAS